LSRAGIYKTKIVGAHYGRRIRSWCTLKFFYDPCAHFPIFPLRIWISRGIDSINAFDYARSGGGNVEIELTQRFLPDEVAVTCTNVISRPWCTYTDFTAQIKWISRGIDSINAFDYARSGGGNVEMKWTQRFSSGEDASGSKFWGFGFKNNVVGCEDSRK
jgi:hypothetical protein